MPEPKSKTFQRLETLANENIVRATVLHISLNIERKLSGCATSDKTRVLLALQSVIADSLDALSTQTHD